MIQVLNMLPTPRMLLDLYVSELSDTQGTLAALLAGEPGDYSIWIWFPM